MSVRKHSILGAIALICGTAWMSAKADPAPVVGNKLPTELQIIPPDAGLFVSIRVNRLWESEIVKPIREMLTKEDPKLFAEIERNIGFRIVDIDRLSILMPTLSPESGEPIFFVTTVNALDLKEIISAMKAIPSTQRDQFERDGGIPKKSAPIPVPSKSIDEKKFEFKKIDEFKQKESPVAFQRQPNPTKEPDLNATYFVARGGMVLIPVDERTIALLPTGGRRSELGMVAMIAQSLRRKATGELRTAIDAAAGDADIVVGINPQEMLKQVPANEPGILPFRPLVDTRSLTLSMKVAKTITFDAIGNYPTPAAATKAAKTVDALRTLAASAMPGLRKQIEFDPEMKSFLPIFDELEKAMDAATIEAKESLVLMHAELKTDRALPVLVANLTAQLREANRRTVVMNNLKQIGIGWHAFHDVYGVMPTFYPGAKHPVSWRVAILPYLEQENLFCMYKFDEPWDSENNKKLIPLMPKVYEMPGFPTDAKGTTWFRTFTGPGTLMEPNKREPGGYERIPLSSVTDGLSNTIMVIEAAEAEVWTKPEGLPFDPKKELPKIGGHMNDIAFVLMGDGSVRFINTKKVSANTLRNAIQRHDGNVLGSDWYSR